MSDAIAGRRILGWASAAAQPQALRSTSGASPECPNPSAWAFGQAAARDFTGHPEPGPAPVRTAVIAHSQPGYASALQQSLVQVGMQVLLTTDDGAEALGAVGAEQPTVLVCGDRPRRMTGCSLLAETALSSPARVLLAQVDNGASQTARDVGAAVVVLRRDPPADVVAVLARLLTEPPLRPPVALTEHAGKDPR